MNFSVSSGDLLKALNIVNGVVPSKSTQPIHECILFEREDDSLKLSAKDEELAISQKVAVDFSGDHPSPRIAVPAKRILETLRALPELVVHFQTGDDFQIEMTTDQGRYQMVGYDGDDYPRITPPAEGKTLESNGALLKRAFQKTGFAVSRDALRPAMMGIFFTLESSGSTVVATDGHRLVKLEMDNLTSDEPVSFIIPEKALSIVHKVADESPCTLQIGAGHVGFNFSHTHLVARIIDETYPKYESVIPKDNQRRLTVHRDSLLAAVRRVGLYSSSVTHQIRLKLEDNEIEISAEDIERASKAREHVKCEYSEEALEIGFNANYLVEVLNNIDGDEVVFMLGTPNRAGIVHPVKDHAGERLIMLIMPVMLGSYPR